MATYTICDMDDCGCEAEYSITKEARELLGVSKYTEDICEECLHDYTNFDDMKDKLEIDSFDQVVLKEKK